MLKINIIFANGNRRKCGSSRICDREIKKVLYRYRRLKGSPLLQDTQKDLLRINKPVKSDV